VVGLLLRSVRVFRQFAWLEVGSVNVASPYPTHQYAQKHAGHNASRGAHENQE